MDERTVIDIGEIVAVVGIAEEDHGRFDTIAIGSRGTVKFGMLAAVSRGEIRTEHGLLWSIQIQQFLDDCRHRMVECLEVGEVIKFAPQGEVWRKACARGKDDPTFYDCCYVLQPSATYRWVDMNGEPTDEPEWFREARALFEKDVIDGEPVAKDNPVGASVRVNMDVGEVHLISCKEIGCHLRDTVFHVCSRGGSFNVKFDYTAFNVIGQDVVLRSPALDILAFKWFMKEPDDLKPREEVKVPSISKGLVWMRDNYAFRLGGGQELQSLAGVGHATPWVDTYGQAIAEPDWARTLEAFRLLYGYCNWSKSYAYGKEEGSFGYDEFSLTKLVMDAYARKLPKSLISGDEVDGSPDYKVIRAAAKTINRHIWKGDDTPNPVKMKAFFEEFGSPWIESFGSDYLEALRKSVEEIHRSKENGYRLSVSVPHKYSPVSYPGTGVISEPM